MPTQVSYPGVYIAEASSGVRTITGVATSITAFIGRAARGPVNEATTISSFADFERTFGGVKFDFPMSYAVRDFYLNGGTQAVIVRLFNSGGNNCNATAVKDGELTLSAASPGTLGNRLQYKCDNDGTAASDFNLTIYETSSDGTPVFREIFRNVSCDPASNRRVDLVLMNNSVLVQAAKPGAATVPELLGKLKSLAGGTDGIDLTLNEYAGSELDKTGIFALDEVDLFNLLCIPPANRVKAAAQGLWTDLDTDAAVYSKALDYCFKRRAMLLVDSPHGWETDQGTINDASKLKSNPRAAIAANLAGLTGTMARNAAAFFPRVIQLDSEQDSRLDRFVPCGVIAGIMARTDATRGVWKAPAGIDASLNGVDSLSVKLTDAENGILNPVGINCLRTFPAAGNVVWGARTLRGDDQLGDEYKYIPVRRTALYIEESLYRGTQWAVFEPNDEPLWAQLRLNIGAFMHDLYRQGAFQGRTPRDAYFVKCDKETTTQNDIDRGIVNVIVGFAPLKPAEFVVITLTQIAGQLET